MVSARRRKCSDDPNSFCYICGELTFLSQKRVIDDTIRSLYHAYFGIQLGDQDKERSPHIVCQKCFINLNNWSRNKISSLPFGIPMIWREPKNHLDDCYFCMVKTSGFNLKNKSIIQYPSLPPAIRPVPHSNDVPIPPFLKPELETVETDCYQIVPDPDPENACDIES